MWRICRKPLVEGGRASRGALYLGPGPVDSLAISYAGRDNSPGSPYWVASRQGLNETALAADDLEAPPGRRIEPHHGLFLNVLYGDYHAGRLDWELDLHGRADAIGPGGVPPLDGLLNGQR